PRRPSPASGRAMGPGVAPFDHALAGQVVEVAADGRRREPEPLAEVGGGDRTLLQNEPGHSRARTVLGPAFGPARGTGHAGCVRHTAPFGPTALRSVQLD